MTLMPSGNSSFKTACRHNSGLDNDQKGHKDAHQVQVVTAAMVAANSSFENAVILMVSIPP